MKCIICGKEEEPSRYYSEKTLQENQMCFFCNFWKGMLEQDRNYDPHEVVIIDGTHYIIGDELSSDPFRGFGGAKFHIRFNDGYEIDTTNLWCQGDIPPEWRDKFPDNAEFDWKWQKIGTNNYLIRK